MASPPRASPSTPPLRPREAIGLSKRRSSPLYGVRAVGSFLPALTRKAFEKYGFSTAALVTDWVRIVGRELAAATAPERLKWPRGVAPADVEGNAPGQGRRGATLILRVDGGLSLDVQHKARQIIERINGYLGYGAVARLKLEQGRLPKPRQSAMREPGPLQPAEQAALDAAVGGIGDPDLRRALDALGRAVKGLRRPANPAK